MATWRYEISLWVLKNISRVSAVNKWNIFSTLIQQHTFINTNELPNHFTLIVFWCERCDLLCSHSNGDIFTCEDNMLFSHVKIPSFRAKVHLVFHWCLCILINLITSIALEKCKKNAKLFKSFWYKVFVH